MLRTLSAKEIVLYLGVKAGTSKALGAFGKN